MAKDFIIQNGALKVDNGDFAVEESEQQHINSIMIADKGHVKRSPLTGVGIRKQVNAPMTGMHLTRLKNKIQKQLQFDGYRIILVSIPNINNISVDAERI